MLKGGEYLTKNYPRPIFVLSYNHKQLKFTIMSNVSTSRPTLSEYITARAKRYANLITRRWKGEGDALLARLNRCLAEDCKGRGVNSDVDAFIQSRIIEEIRSDYPAVSVRLFGLPWGMDTRGNWTQDSTKWA